MTTSRASCEANHETFFYEYESAGAAWGSGHALQAASLLVKPADSALMKVNFFTQTVTPGKGHCPHPHIDTDGWSVSFPTTRLQQELFKLQRCGISNTQRAIFSFSLGPIPERAAASVTLNRRNGQIGTFLICR